MKYGSSLAWTDKRGAFRTLTFDLTIREVHDSSATVTEHPVETGAAVTDHVRDEPDALTLEAFVTEVPIEGEGVAVDFQDLTYPVAPSVVPLTPGAAAGAIQRAAFGTDPGQRRVQTLSLPTGRSRCGETHAALLEAKSEAALISVTTPQRELADMVLTKVTKTREEADGTGATFALEFRKLRFVSVKTVPAPKPTALKAAAKTSKGAQGTKAPEAPERKASIVRRLTK